MYTEISYNGFCQLGALTNPKLFARTISHGTLIYRRYYMLYI